MFRPLIAKRAASSFARVSILGRVGQEPTVQEAGDKSFVRYSVATNPTKDGPASWFNISVFNEKQADFTTNYLQKGALVHIEGDIVNKTYEKPDGSTGYATNIYQTKIDIVRSPYSAEEES